MRLKVPYIYKNPTAAYRLEKFLNGVRGVGLAKANWATGKILIAYHPQQLSLEALLFVLLETGENSLVRKETCLISHQHANRQNRALFSLNLGLAFFLYLWTRDLIRVFTMIIALSPAAIRMAVPAGLSRGLRQAARENISFSSPRCLVKSDEIEQLYFAQASLFPWDHGKITEITVLGRDEKYILSLVSAFQEMDKYFWSQAIKKRAESQGIKPVTGLKLQEITAIGFKGSLTQKKILLGSPEYLRKNNLGLEHFRGKIRRVEHLGGIPFLLVESGNVLAIFSIKEHLREECKESLNQLRQEGIKNLCLIRGDLRDEYLSQELGLNLVYPEEVGGKGAIILRKNATDLDVIFHGNHFKDLVKLISLGKQTKEVINQNLTWSVGLNSMAVILAFGGILSPWSAFFFHSFNILTIFLNSRRPY